jgi:hypothetical protein
MMPEPILPSFGHYHSEKTAAGRLWELPQHDGPSEEWTGEEDLLRLVNSRILRKGTAPLPPKILGSRVNSDHGRAVAIAYEVQAPSQDELTLQAYDALCRETRLQFEHLLAEGYSFTPYLGSGQPYLNSRQMRERFFAERRLEFFLGGDLPQGYLLAERSGLMIGDREATCNDLFRCVHDVIGHALYGNGFGLKGELTAGRVHAATYSPLAQAALFTETVGQTLWFHFGPYAALPIAERPFAIQKGILLPEHLRRFD